MSVSPNDSLAIAEFAALFGFDPEAVSRAVETQRRRSAEQQAFYTIPELSVRWHCSRAQVYSVLRAAAVKVLDIGQGTRRSKTLVPAEAVLRIEKSRMEKMG